MAFELTATCPNCEADCEPEELGKWADTAQDAHGSGAAYVPLMCACGQVFWVTVAIDKMVLVDGVPEHHSEIIPGLPDGLVVGIDNREHPLHGRSGRIVGRKHLHYRIDIDGTKLWVPYHLIKVSEQHG